MPDSTPSPRTSRARRGPALAAGVLALATAGSLAPAQAGHAPGERLPEQVAPEPTDRATAQGIERPGQATMGWSLRDQVRPGVEGTASLGPVGAASAIAPQAADAHGPYGIDTSSHTTVQDWQWFSDVGAEFAWIKATEGDYYTSPVFSPQWIGATEQQMVRGSYHFANPAESSGAQQAEFFVANGGGWSPDGRTLPGALDMEYNPYGPVCYGMDHAQMDAWVRDFIGRYEQLTGVKPVIYTNADWWNTCVGRADYSDIHLWLARYDATPGTAPWSWSQHGATHTVWQTRPVTDKGYDVNRFHGDRAALRELATHG
ncbi:GH25 family lysozyme [Kytococcus sedentarius]|uniref:GH25 family lysozyme n=1 Tax=Kytococcus sedentarius TaxID=1276 RepID=UPI0035BBC47C